MVVNLVTETVCLLLALSLCYPAGSGLQLLALLHTSQLLHETGWTKFPSVCPYLYQFSLSA